jgi:inorganic pyrophosphatase
LKSVLPNGAVFPFDFGSVPGTTADDGDPLDVLLLMDEPAFTGCLVQGRLLGVINAKQTSNGKTERNDRLIAVAAESQIHSSLKFIGDSGTRSSSKRLSIFRFLQRDARQKVRTDRA